MLVSCKCLNFIATSSCQQRYHKSFNSTAAVPTADDVSSPLHPAPMSPAQSMDGDFNMPCNDNGTVAAYAGSGSLTISLMNAFLQKYQPKFPFYSQYMEFFKQ